MNLDFIIRRNKSLLFRGLLLLLAFNSICLVWYIFVGYQDSFHSDSAAKVLLAQEIYKYRDFFPNDWNYVNNDLFIIFGHIFIIPLLAFAKPGFTVHAVSGLISALLIVWSAWLLLGELKVGRARRVAILAVVVAGFSGFMAENLYGQVSYGPVIYLTAFILFFSIRYLKGLQGKQVNIWAALFFIVFFLVVWANPVRAVVAYGLPLGFALANIIFANWSCDEKYRKRAINLVIILVCAACLGLALHLMTLSGVNNIYGAASAKWLPYELMVRNFSLLGKGLLAILGGLPPVNGSVTSIWGVIFALRLLCALCILVLIPISVFRIMRYENIERKFLAVFAVTALAIVLFVQIFTSVPDMSDPVQSSRYLVPSVFFLCVAILLQPISFKVSPLLSGMTVFVLLASIFSAYPVYFRSNVNSEILGQNGQISEQRHALVRFLIENNLHYGYATYWNAGANSVLADGETLVRQIAIDAGIPKPMRHLSSDAWYRADAWTGKTFLLLTREESKLINWEQMKEFGAIPEKTLQFGGFYIFLFPMNISGKIAGWDNRYYMQSTFNASPRSLKQVGTYFEKFENSGTALVAEKNERGALHFGPYVDVGPGRYEVTFDVSAEAAENTTVRLDVAAAPDQKILAQSEFREINNPYTMQIELGKLRTLEFRVWALGQSKVIFRSVKIKRLKE